MIYEKRLFDEIESVLPVLQSKTFNDIEQRRLVGKLIKELVPSVQVDLACDGCIMNYLNHLLAFYEREYPKHIKTQQVKEIEAVPVETPLKPKKKPKRNGK